MGFRSLVAALVASAAVSSGCTVASVGAEHGPARIESVGLIEGHAAVGIRAEDEFLRLRVLEGDSDGALGEIVLWKLFRLEVGALGLSVGIGPVDLGLGTLFYEPEVPRMQGAGQEEAVAPADPGECELCKKQAP